MGKPLHFVNSAKRQLISKENFGVFKSTKEPTIFEGFLPSKTGQIKKQQNTLLYYMINNHYT
jgi:hypothetical protein